MARVRVTVPIAGGYPHREHRSKKGRKKKVFSEQKPPAYPVYLENDEQIINKNDRFKVMDNPQEEFKETITLGDVLDLPPVPKEQRHRYPKLVCENCGHHNQLNFSPLKEDRSLASVECHNCHEMAYHSFYWADYQMKSAIFFRTQTLLRDLIKTGKTTLLNLRNLW